MPWILENGKPVRIDTQLSPQEISVTPPDLDEGLLVCPECGREYKTETGLENHLATKH